MNRVGLGLAVGAGYVLGRTKKMKLAFALGTLVAGKRMHLTPRGVADLVSQQLQNNPQFKEIGDQLREDLRGVGKAASGAMVERQIDALADRLHGRTAEVRDQLEGVTDQVPGLDLDDDEEAEEEETEDEEQREEYDDEESDGEESEAEESEAEESEADEEPPAGGSERGSAKEAAGKAPARKAAAKRAPARRTPAKKAPAKKAAAKKSASKQAPAKQTAKKTTGRKAGAARGAARGARTRLPKGGGE
ncbi:DNA primase [Streptomyces sp. NPDC001617]